MRAFLRHNYLSAIGAIKRPRNGVHILNSHYISPTTTDAEIFYKQLDKMKGNVTFIDIEEAVDLVNKKTKVNDALVAFTYDDGFEQCYSSIAPVLNSYNVSAGFFINPNFTDGDLSYQADFLTRIKQTNKKAMSWKQIKELHEQGHVIGSHTMDHLDLGNTNLTQEELEEQLGKSKQIIQEKIGNKCSMFAFPFGQFRHLSEAALEVALEHYDTVFSGTDYKNYFSFNGKVINRRHCEPFWPVSHLNYFLSSEKSYNIRS